jgi:hypothetical protein
MKSFLLPVLLLLPKLLLPLPLLLQGLDERAGYVERC